MDYAEAAAAFFVLRQEGTALPVAVAEGSPARRLRDACEPVAMHAVWSRATNERLAQLGLDFLTSYVGGRGAFLGEAAGAVVAAAFAWFEPGLVATLWDAARAAVGAPPAEQRTAHAVGGRRGAREQVRHLTRVLVSQDFPQAGHR